MAKLGTLGFSGFVQFNIDLIAVDFKAIGYSECSQKKSNGYCLACYNHIVSDFLACAFRKV